MNSVPSTVIRQQTSILQLNHDLLSEIFERYTSLYTIRQLSQVCQKWRELLLESPSIWARNVDLNALNQSSDRWRNLVLKRTGRAMLSVWGRQPTMTPKAPSLEFLIDLLEKHWPRIRDLQISLNLSALDNERLWKALARPAPLLQTFSCIPGPNRRHPDYSSLQNFPSNFQLFSNQAPSLMKLVLTRFPPISLNITSSTFVSNNMRSLIITQPFNLSDTSLLTACMQMPCVEELSLSLAQFVRSHPSNVNALRPPVPRLNSITLTDADISIYSTFLDRIIPSPDCSLTIEHRLNVWSVLETSQLAMEDIAHMHRVVGRYIKSYFEHRATRRRKVKSMVHLMVFQHAFIYSIPERRRQFDIRIAHDLTDNILLMLFESLLTVGALKSFTALELDIRSNVDFLSLSSPLQAFHSMSSITVLHTCPVGLSYLGHLEQPESLFPHLHTIFLREFEGAPQVTDKLQPWIQPFLTVRHHKAPIKVLEFKSPFRRVTDLRFLDTLSGLKIVGIRYEDWTPLEYVCGSGDEQQLYVQAKLQAEGQEPSTTVPQEL